MATDSVNREKLFDILKAYGIPVQIVSAIVSMYYNSEAKVCSPDGETNFFTIHAGVLSSVLFIIALKYAMRSQLKATETLDSH